MNHRALLRAVVCAAVLTAGASSTRAAAGEASPANATETSDPAAASVNACGAGAGTLGVRVNAPYRGDRVEPWVRVQVEWYSSEDGGWHPAPAGGDSGWYRAGDPGTGAWTGYTFPFASPNPGRQLIMRGVATIEWRGEGAAPAPAQAVTPLCQLQGG